MKNLNVAITDQTDERLDKIIRVKGFRNRADAVDWIIQEIFKITVKEG